MSKTFHYDDTLGFVRRTLRYGNAPTIIESTIGQLNSDPAVNEANANTSNELNALDCVEERKKGEWDMFDLISSAYYGKGMYFKQDNGTVYSRHSGEYMTVDEAIREFISLIDGENIAFVDVREIKHGRWSFDNIIFTDSDGVSRSAMWGYKCSECGGFCIGESNFCPNCGADMRKQK